MKKSKKVIAFVILTISFVYMSSFNPFNSVCPFNEKESILVRGI